MTITLVRRAGLALAFALAIAGTGTTTVLAQESIGAAVTIGGGVSGVGAGSTVVLAPGVTISGGDVSNSTGIGVLVGGGSSIGTTAGGDDSAAVTE